MIIIYRPRRRAHNPVRQVNDVTVATRAHANRVNSVLSKKRKAKKNELKYGSGNNTTEHNGGGAMVHRWGCRGVSLSLTHAADFDR